MSEIISAGKSKLYRVRAGGRGHLIDADLVNDRYTVNGKEVSQEEAFEAMRRLVAIQRRSDGAACNM